MSDNMRIYNPARSVPPEAKKPITAGRLKGMTDVNPMYRIKRLTEMFGPCGIGWWYVINKREIVDDETTHQRAAIVDIDLYYVDPETGETSKGIPGTGGAAFVSQERNGPYLSDECFKMALTDALSVACKAIGIAADVYWDKDRTKYSGNAANAQNAPSKPTDPKPKQEPTPAPKTADRAVSDGFVPATAEQIEYIKGNASDADYQAYMEEFGAELENLCEADARRVINEINAHNTDHTKCTRCGKVITGWALPDGSLMSAPEIIGKSKITYGDVYCWPCCVALKKEAKKREAQKREAS